MRKFKMQKLVRDKMADNIRARQAIVEDRTLDDKEYFDELKKKLKEETDELLEVSFGDKENMTNELADIQLLIDYLAKVSNISKEDLKKKKAEKEVKVGNFDKKIFIETVTMEDDDKWVEYYVNKGFEEVK